MAVRRSSSNKPTGTRPRTTKSRAKAKALTLQPPDPSIEIKVSGAEVTAQSLIAEAEAARMLAMSARQASAAIAAITAKAKLAGLWIDRGEQTNLHVEPETLSDAELARIAAPDGGTNPHSSAGDKTKLA